MADESTLKDLPAHTKVKHSSTPISNSQNRTNNNNNNLNSNSSGDGAGAGTGAGAGAGIVANIISPTHSSILASFTPRRSLRKHKKKKRKLPRFPNRPESLITVEHLPVRIKQLEDYLYNLLNISLYRYHHETVSRLGMSYMAIDRLNWSKIKHLL